MRSMLLAAFPSHRAVPSDLERDWRGMAWVATGPNWVSGSGWACRAILSPVGDQWSVLIDGTPCRHAAPMGANVVGGTVMTWPDRLQAGCQAHELLAREFCGPAMRPRMPFRLVPRADVALDRCIPCAPTRGRRGHDGSCQRPAHCIRPSLEADGAGIVIMDVELERALQTIGGRACFADEEAARHAYRSEVARWLSLT